LAALFDQRRKVFIPTLLPCGEVSLALLCPRLPTPRAFLSRDTARTLIIALRFKHLAACIEKGGGDAKHHQDQ
jgi:hypothetical protein